MSEYDKMHDYLNDQTFYDKFPEAWKVKKLYDEKVKDLERKLAEARESLLDFEKHVIKYNYHVSNPILSKYETLLKQLKEKGGE